MKLFPHVLILSLALFSSLSFAAVDSKKIKTVANGLGKDLPSNVFKVKPNSPVNMMKELAKKHLDMDDFNYDPTTATDGDSAAWGLVKMSQVIGWVQSAELLANGTDRMSHKQKKAGDMVRSLVGSGVVFGAGPFGAVQCGGQYPALMLIDTEAGLIYTFETEGSGC